MKSDSYYREMFSRNQRKYRERLKEEGKRQLNVYIPGDLMEVVISSQGRKENRSEVVERIIREWMELKSSQGKNEKTEETYSETDKKEMSVEYILKLYERYSFTQIAQILNEEGYTNPKTGNRWNRKSISKIVKENM